MPYPVICFFESMKTWYRFCWFWRYFSHTWSILWCFSHVWTHLVLQPTYLKFGIWPCSRWLSAWLHLDDWWGWWFCTSCRAIGCPFYGVYWSATESMGRPFSCFPELITDLCQTSIMVSPSAWTSSAGILSTAADFPLFSAATASSTSSWRIGCRSSSGCW